ncbi:hypothetical protein ABPG74_020978 [Tetrahymena malaccensis]
MKDNLKLFLLSSLSLTVFFAHDLIGNKKLRSLQPTMKTALTPTYGSTSNQISDVGSANTGSTKGLSTGAQIAIYVSAAIGLTLILLLINYLWRRYTAHKARLLAEKIKRDVQLKNAQQQNHQISQIPVFYNQGQINPNIQGYPQNFQFQVYPNQNNQNFY